MQSTAYIEGQQAWHEDAEVTDNPYACSVPAYMQPQDAVDWRAGWEDEDRKHRAELMRAWPERERSAA